MRLFVAADLPPEVRAACAAWRDTALGPRSLRPVGDASLHLTLSFLGEVAEERVPELTAGLEACVAPAGGLVLGPGRWLPPRGFPRVLVVGVQDPSSALRSLHGCVARVVGDPSTRTFLPHVTVARVAGRFRPFHPAGIAPLEFAAAALTLYRSHLGRGPAVYEPVWRAALPAA